MEPVVHNLAKCTFFNKTPSHFTMLGKAIENLEFVQGVDFEFIVSLKINGTKYLLVFDDSCEEICISQAFVDVATAGRYRGFSTIHIKHKLFHQSKFGRDVELQNTHFVLFKSPRDVMQVKTLGAELGLGSELVDWYWDAISVSHGHSMIDLSPRTDDRLRYCTKAGSIPSKFCTPDSLKLSKILDEECRKFLSSPSHPIISPQMQKSSPSVLPKRIYQVPLRMYSKLSQGSLQSIKRHHVTKFQNEVRLLFLKRTFWKQSREVLASEKWLQFLQVNTPPVTNRLSWYGAVCFPACFCVQQQQQEFECSGCYKAGTSKVSSWTKSHVPFWFTWNGNKQKLFAKVDTLVDKTLSCSRIKLSNSQTLISDAVETVILLSDFA